MHSIFNLSFVLGISLVSLCSAAPSLPQEQTHATDSGPEKPRPTLWKPGKDLKWNYILNGTIGKIDPTVDVYDVDLFDTSDADWKALKKANKKIICYFSAGSLEDWRNDSKNFDDSDFGKGVQGWAGEYWLNTSSPNVRQIMVNRVKYAANRGCDGVEPDNIDGFDNHKPGEPAPFNLTVETAREYLGFLANQTAKPLNLSIGPKNGDASRWLDWLVNEECVLPPGDDEKAARGPNECGRLAPFVQKGKPVFHVEYDEGVPDRASAANVKMYCDKSTTAGFSNVIKDKFLTQRNLYCP